MVRGRFSTPDDLGQGGLLVPGLGVGGQLPGRYAPGRRYLLGRGRRGRQGRAMSLLQIGWGEGGGQAIARRCLGEHRLVQGQSAAGRVGPGATVVVGSSRSRRAGALAVTSAVNTSSRRTQQIGHGLETIPGALGHGPSGEVIDARRQIRQSELRGGGW